MAGKFDRLAARGAAPATRTAARRNPTTPSARPWAVYVRGPQGWPQAPHARYASKAAAERAAATLRAEGRHAYAFELEAPRTRRNPRVDPRKARHLYAGDLFSAPAPKAPTRRPKVGTPEERAEKARALLLRRHLRQRDAAREREKAAALRAFKAASSALYAATLRADVYTATKYRMQKDGYGYPTKAMERVGTKLGNEVTAASHAFQEALHQLDRAGLRNSGHAGHYDEMRADYRALHGGNDPPEYTVPASVLPAAYAKARKRWGL